MALARLTGWRYLLAVWIAGASTLLMAAEEPSYEVLETRGDVEVRRYGPAILAETRMKASGGDFRRLAGFIFGGNSTGESIAMTAPVQADLDGEQPQMAFFMPPEYDMGSLPEPDDAGVTLREIPARTVAVLRFSGRATDKRVTEQRNKLAQLLVAEGLEADGTWLLNQYNPPWTPPFMRRNEIWVGIKWDDPQGSSASAAL